MEHNHFFPPREGISLASLATQIGAELHDIGASERLIRSVAPVYRAKQGDICYILSRRSKQELDTCEASAILCDKALAPIIPAHIPVLLTSSPATAFAFAGALLFPSAMRPVAISPAMSGVSPAAFVDPSARLEADVLVEPMAVIGADAEIGEGCRIGPGAVIGAGVKIGRGCTIAGGATVQSALIGNNVIIHNGARIGQDGFGYAPGPRGMLKIVQVGRVIIQDHVEIGANTTIDRGTMDDTVIGEGTKIDNLVQIGHNVRIGRHCGIVAQVGIAGSTKVGDGVMIGGASGVNGHITIGDGAQIAAMSGVLADVPPGERYGGVPARPLKDFLKDVAASLSQAESRKHKGGKND
ncbi:MULTISPECIES: UDP-3-O-(3-hydroxymyristoyl)glucosamine N-acyltransferase [Alphaproteobacteria]|uniref:UDP-3-O-acylglucosamine N-acyltransferase n=2 Tax=Alphaproteobacteria TaxID=28211 RepID=A0A512HHM4_9HYPH|nr:MULTISPECIES: UDP-3-O-(3-hydroxymyristoyl)glucosamine N-acyltransferase [Alphaproteobacteria]GEO84951.1 UDP-3-O-acylglucosamine N-acyltransferase [Ciceribacter naphthalenivorans]GLR22885.1 UDP-3-O-acylglucosamine N-acyltransferase [Ciceribacter naphthalenivorans]GLT05741.1 UDP-3-O-acylglucosamine N-acyltransferase [Sphingomonas psychrolutea]